MKKFTLLSKKHLLLLCLTFAFGLMSCEEQEEIIPLETTTDLENSEWDYKSHIVLAGGEEGGIEGYLDSQGRLVNEAGHVIPQPEAGVDFIFSAYSSPQFNGSRKKIFYGTSSTSTTFNIPKLDDYNIGNTISSIVIPRNVEIKLYDNQNYSNFLESYNTKGTQKPKYVAQVTKNSKASSIKVTINHKSNICGYAYSSTNGGGGFIPVFLETEVNVDDWNWWKSGSGGANRISSFKGINKIKSGINTSCGGVVLWEGATSPDREKVKKRRSLTINSNMFNVSTLNKKISSVSAYNGCNVDITSVASAVYFELENAFYSPELRTKNGGWGSGWNAASCETMHSACVAAKTFLLGSCGAGLVRYCQTALTNSAWSTAMASFNVDVTGDILAAAEAGQLGTSVTKAITSTTAPALSTQKSIGCMAAMSVANGAYKFDCGNVRDECNGGR